jgi:hypothetical protein
MFDAKSKVLENLPVAIEFFNKEENDGTTLIYAVGENTADNLMLNVGFTDDVRKSIILSAINTAFVHKNINHYFVMALAWAVMPDKGLSLEQVREITPSKHSKPIELLMVSCISQDSKYLDLRKVIRDYKNKITKFTKIEIPRGETSHEGSLVHLLDNREELLKLDKSVVDKAIQLVSELKVGLNQSRH